MDIKDFYLKTPMARYKYMRLQTTNMLNNVIKHYQLTDLTTPDGYIYCEIKKGMYGLPQVGIIAQQLLEKRLKQHRSTKVQQHPACGNTTQDQFPSP